MIARVKMKDTCSIGLIGNSRVSSGVKVGGTFIIECFDKHGDHKWTQHCPNLVVNVGLQHLLDVLMSGSTQTDPWYVGLTGSSPSPAAGDTMASHAGWTEVTASDYDETARQAYVEVRSGQSMSNSASKAVFTMNKTVTVGGAFLVSDNSGTAGTLLCCAAASEGNRNCVDDDVLNVTYTFTAADDGA